MEADAEDERKKSKVNPWLTKEKDLPASDPEPSLKGGKKKEKKPVKKERARVQRGTATTWGFWGAASGALGDPALKLYP
jgi:hypothetical protein